MLKPIIILFVSVLIFSCAYSSISYEHDDMKEYPIIIGILLTDNFSRQFYNDNLGKFCIVHPLETEDGIKTIARNGWVCEIYDHSFVNQKCKLCGANK